MTSSKTCLIVDDSKVIRMVARKILQELEFKTEEAADGKEAMDACKNSMPDVVLLDWNMPVMSGIEFLRELLGMYVGEVPAVLFCTPETEIEHLQAALEASANYSLIKHFSCHLLTPQFSSFRPPYRSAKGPRGEIKRKCRQQRRNPPPFRSWWWMIRRSFAAC